MYSEYVVVFNDRPTIYEKGKYEVARETQKTIFLIVPENKNPRRVPKNEIGVVKLMSANYYPWLKLVIKADEDPKKYFKAFYKKLYDRF